MSTTTKLYAGLVRVSDMGERKADDDTFHSASDQVAAIKAATPKGADVEFMPHELDVSGGLELERRPSLVRAVEGVEAGTYAGIIVAYTSRLTRNREVREQVLRRIYAAGGEVRDKRGKIDWNTADGRMVESFMGAIDANGRERKAEEFEALREKTVAAGKFAAGRPPRGYRVEPSTGRLVRAERGGAQRMRKRDGAVSIYPAAPVVAAFESVAAGETITGVAQRLGMTQSGLRALLRNRTYLGELRSGGHVNTSAHEPLVSVELFETVQAALAENPRPGRRSDGAPALLARLVRCSSCGHVMTRGGAGGGMVYRCPGRHSGEHCPGPAAIRVEPLDTYVEAVALAYMERLVAEGVPGAELAEAEQHLTSVERELEGYLTAVSVDTVGVEAFQAGAVKRREAVEEAKAEQRRLRALSPSLPTAAQGTEVWDELDVRERNTLLRAMLAAVVVAPVGRGRNVPVPARARVIEAGTDWLELPHNGGGWSGGILPIPLPDLEAPGVLRLPGPLGEREPCGAFTNRGKPCKNWAEIGEHFCNVHADQEVAPDD